MPTNTYLSRALAYFSKSLFAMSESYSKHQARKRNHMFAENTHFNLDKLVAIAFVNIFEFLEVGLDCLKLYTERTQFTVDAGTLARKPCQRIIQTTCSAFLHLHASRSLSASPRYTSRRRFVSLSRPRPGHTSQFPPEWLRYP